MFKMDWTRLKKSLSGVLVIGLAAAMLALWVLAINRTANQRLSQINIHVNSIEGVRSLIDENEIFTLLNEGLQYDMLIMPMKHIDLRKIESLLAEDSRIHFVEVYVDAQNNLTIDIRQRRPILRVMNDNGQQYYLDQEGSFVGKTEFKAVRVPVVTGAIEAYDENWKWRPDSKLNMAYEIALRLHNDAFLAGLIEQIHFDRGHRIYLIPKVGNEKIVLDYVDDLDAKLKKLKPLYKHLANTNGWGKYKEIDISYNKQVIGRNPVKP